MCFVQVYFSQFGAVKDVTILTDHVTQRSRGFGFVVYEDPNSVNAVLSHRYHELDGRKAPRLGRCCASPVTPGLAGPPGGSRSSGRACTSQSTASVAQMPASARAALAAAAA